MITFNKKSWHYRFNKCVGNSKFPVFNATRCKSICPYFWQTLWNICATLFGLSIAYLMLTAIGGGAIQEYLPNWSTTPYPLWWLWLAGIATIIIMMLMVALIVTVPVLLFLGFKWMFKKLSTKNQEKLENEQPSVIIEWVKAKKAKICPMIEFKD